MPHRRSSVHGSEHQNTCAFHWQSELQNWAFFPISVFILLCIMWHTRIRNEARLDNVVCLYVVYSALWVCSAEAYLFPIPWPRVVLHNNRSCCFYTTRAWPRTYLEYNVKVLSRQPSFLRILLLKSQISFVFVFFRSLIELRLYSGQTKYSF